MEFEFDSAKNETMRQNYRIDFVEAQALWDDPDKVGFPAKSEDNESDSLIAMLEKKLSVAFYTLSGNKIRIISV